MEASPMSLFENFIKEAYGSQFVIPAYQRNYTWRKNKQVKQLLDDIEKILTGETKRHFMGTIVYVIMKTDFIVRERAIVDGQQRLITMFLIAFALKRISADIGQNEISNIITSSYLENSNAIKEYKFRLKPAVTDDDTFQLISEQKFDKLQGNTTRLNESYNSIEEVLRKYVLDYGLVPVINAIRELYVVRIQLDKNDDAQQIFESINSTGEKLTAADLIRNYIMMNKINEKQEEIYNKYWLELELIFIESKDMEQFFRLYLGSKNFVLFTIKDLYNSFKKFWNNQLANFSEDEILFDILNYAKHFNRLYYSNNNDDVLGIELFDFRKMQSFMPAPFLMEVLEFNRRTLITNKHVKEILLLINTYLIRRYIAGQDTSAITRVFPTFLKNVIVLIEKHGFINIVDICTYVLVSDTRQKSTFMPDDEQVRQYLTSANAYVLQLTKWLLDKIENQNNPIKIDTSILSIEHIMPQTPNEYWYNITGLTKEDYELNVNKIGNLTLAALNDNSKMQNYDFEFKKTILKSTGHLKLNEQILLEPKWTVENINNRTNELINKILEMFPYTKSKIDYAENDISRNVILNRAEIIATGYLHENQNLTVHAGSTVRYSTMPSLNSLKDLREEFLETEIVVLESGIHKFVQDYTFNSPSAAADFLIGGSNNGWDCWKDEKGVKINDSLRKLSAK